MEQIKCYCGHTTYCDCGPLPKQTAVEWLIEEMHKNIDWIPIPMQEQAKEIEAKQRQEDTNHGYSQGYDDGAEGAEPMKPEIKN
jgi:hypothetical protein